MPNLSNENLIKYIDKLSYLLILINIFFLPLFIDGRLINIFNLPKQYLFISLTLLNILLFAAQTIISKKISYRRSIIDLPLLLFLIAILASALFSLSRYTSFLGRSEYFSLNFIFILSGAIFYFIFINLVKTPQRWRGILDTLLTSSLLVSVLFVLKTKFSLSLPLIGGNINLIDASNTQFGVWIVVIAVLSIGLLLKKNPPVWRAIFYSVSSLMSLVVVLSLGYNFLWWLLLAGLILLLLLGVSLTQEVKSALLSVLFAFLVVTSIIIIFGSPKFLQSVLPVEMSLSNAPSWSITKSTIFSSAKNFILGSGLGTFGADFSKYRSEAFNYDRIAWSLRFNQPTNTVFAILAEGGVATLVILLFILFFVIGHALSTWFKERGPFMSQGRTMSLYLSKDHFRLDVFLLVVVWILLWGGMAIVYYTSAIWSYWWLFLGLVMTGLNLLGHEVIKENDWTVEDSPQYHLAFSFSIILIMSAAIMLGIFGVRFYWAETNYAAAMQATNLNEAESKLNSAILLRSDYDNYHKAIAQIYLLKAGEEAKKTKPDTTVVAGLVASAVNEAKNATDLSPNSVAIWENLSAMYENATLLVPEANNWAIKSLIKALELEPTNAYLYWRLGNNYYLSGNFTKAEEALKKATELKKDYVSAYTGLAITYENNKQNDKAIDAYKGAIGAGANSAETLFNLGRLMYNRNKNNDRVTAENLWLLSLQLQPNYSNSIYSLGLLYEGKGDKIKALQFYNKVKELNPENTDIAAKIKSMTSYTPTVEAVKLPTAETTTSTKK